VSGDVYQEAAMKSPKKQATVLPVLLKVPTGIQGLDEITGGGLPKGRPTLIYGSAGSGKTLIGMEFLVRGALEYNDPGVFMSFEETEGELTTNVGTLGFDLKNLIDAKKLSIDYVAVERSEIEETGEYNLEGLFVRLGEAIDTIHAKRVVLDTIEVLFAGLSNAGVVRSELRRLFRWLKDKGVTTIVTGERGDGPLTRHGLEEYVSDCVIFLDNRISEEMSTRRLRIIKYRGSAHSTNEFPFIIDENGVSILPVTTVKLDYPSSIERISTGVPRLDDMLDGKGYIKGTAVLVSGMAGTGKSSLAAHFVDAGCRRGQRCLYFAFEEAPSQIIRNMRSIGIDLEPWVKKGRLQFHATRVSEQGLEKHLFYVQQAVAKIKPDLVVVDAVTDFTNLGVLLEVRQMVLRLIDFLKQREITSLCTSMVSHADLEETGVGLSSAFDTWIHLTNVQNNLERNRTIVVVKSRGMAHSNQVREFVLTDKGVKLEDIYASPAGSFMGTARLTQMAADAASDIIRHESITMRERQIEEKRRVLEARIAALSAEYGVETKEAELVIAQHKAQEKAQAAELKTLSNHRKAGRQAGKEGGRIKQEKIL
jgi:circadian clock protein KaiC